MLIEQTLEGKILDSISAILPDVVDTTLVGFWQPTAAGVVWGWESDASSPVLVGVLTSLGSQDTFSNPEVTFSVEVSLNVRLDLDASADLLAPFAEAISGLFRDWMSATYQKTFTALDFDGLSIDGVGVQGKTPQIDAANKISRVAWTLVLSGSYQTATPETGD